MSKLVEIITSKIPEVRNQSLDQFCRGKSMAVLLQECAALEKFRKESNNLYEKVRALFFLYAIHRFYIPYFSETGKKAVTPYQAYEHILNRRFEEAIEILLRVQDAKGVNEGLSSALADAWHKLAFQTLADQVKISVRIVVRDSSRISSFQARSFCRKNSRCRSFMNGSSSLGRYSFVEVAISELQAP